MQGNRQMSMPPFPPVIKNLIIINFLVWMAQSFLGANVSAWMDNTFALHSFYSPLFKPWQIVTHMFMHSPFGSSLGIMHILLNMFGLWMFGSALEINMGAKRFLSFYLISGVGAAIIYLGYLQIHLHPIVAEFQRVSAEGAPQNILIQYREIINESMIGASGAVFGVLAGFGYLFPNTYLYIYFFLPLKTKWAVIGIIAYELYGAIASSAGDDVAHVAHLGGAFVGFLIIYIWNKKNRQHFY
ncbi:MAG TPA: rhomboid family intramembrane serine protease [Arachidicoccus soli]|uniref:Rhomboid family intramembrane serine protease n=1 Tax=Arachidicoccus soli TaxID=2341117 RepID=A0A386HM45_9BACT|nr:rhomboid family intramembrane serine protease [Arachidicoccus soli]AYD46699.1 rhomboid family intramembrane serine protease [Arachidicoccus soli]HEU0227050.1 rhomboid family intramembrane serine protease [Arachidicoccus soli]